MNSPKQYCLLKRLGLPFLLLVFSLISFVSAKAQEKPPRPVTVKVSTAQHLNFGTIIPISEAGGSLEVYYDNSSIKSGDILQLRAYECRSALFIVDSEPGVLINIVYPDDSPQLSNGNNHLQLHLSTPYIDNRPAFQFVTRSTTTYVFIGGTLTVGSMVANPAGSYNGEFQVTFIQQ